MTDQDLGARPQARGRRRLATLLPAAGLAVVLVALALVVALRGGGDEPAKASKASKASRGGAGAKVPAEWHVTGDLCTRLDLAGVAKGSGLAAAGDPTGQVRTTSAAGPDFTCRQLASGTVGTRTGPVTITAGGTLYADAATATAPWKQAQAAAKRPDFDGRGQKAKAATTSREGWWQQGTELDVTRRTGPALVRLWVRERGLVAWVSVSGDPGNNRAKGLRTLRALADGILERLPAAAS